MEGVMSLTAEQLRDMLVYVAQRVIDKKQLLTEKDSAIGDGDHGIGMSTGFSKVKDRLTGLQPQSVNEVFTAAGRALMTSMGGASGVVFSTLFLGGAKGMPLAQSLNEEEFAEFFRRSLSAIKDRGGAALGDKTMIDALEPAVFAMLRGTEEGFSAMLEKGAQAAREGMEGTKNLIARHGRAIFLQERSIGHEDPGAVSVWIIFEAMHGFAANIA
jgi:dihydroxyacetone kinase phosphoprotein-dependent L subunit